MAKIVHTDIGLFWANLFTIMQTYKNHHKMETQHSRMVEEVNTNRNRLINMMRKRNRKRVQDIGMFIL